MSLSYAEIALEQAEALTRISIVLKDSEPYVSRVLENVAKKHREVAHMINSLADALDRINHPKP